MPALLSLEGALFSDPYSERSLAETLAAPYTAAYLALSDGEPIGYLIATLLPPEGEILRIGVLPALRRRGVARALLTVLLADATRDTSLYLEVRRGNTGALALYASVGFQTVGIRKNYYRSPTEDAVLMCRPSEEEKK